MDFMQITIHKVQDSVTPSINNLIKSISSTGKNQLLLFGGRELLRQTRNNFGGGSQYRDKNWSPLSKAYAKKVGHYNATDERTGQLKNSILLGRPRSNFIEIYTRNKYAAAIAFGDKKKKLPARNFWPVQNSGNPSYNRLTYNSDRDLFKVLTTRLNILSNGSFPRQSTMIERMRPEYGSPWTGPQSSGK